MPLEFHVNKSADEINSLYTREAVPRYKKDADYAAMTIDNNGNVCIGKNQAINVIYYKNILTNGISSNTAFANPTRLDVKGVSKFDDIILFDNFTNNYKHIDEVYIRADGVGSIRPSQITAGTFNGLSYSFNIVDVRETLNAKTINATNSITAPSIEANSIVVSENATFRIRPEHRGEFDCRI
jgi:hypothetical protein